MTTINSFAEFNLRLREFICRHALDNLADEFNFNELALNLFALQFESVGPYKNFCQGRNVSPKTISNWSEIPAVPTSAFKDLEISSLPREERTHVFHSSGTTGQKPSCHFHNAESLSIYEASLLPWFQKNFLGDPDALCKKEIIGIREKPVCIFLTPNPKAAPNSSLVHMFETVRKEFGSLDSFFAGKVANDKSWLLEIDPIISGLRESISADRPAAILGTAFSFVHLLDHFAENNIYYKLAPGSRVLETGGYKGWSREIPKSELHSLISKHLGIPASHIICEYSMSELSSQAYAGTQNSKFKTQKFFQFPPWTRAQIISPETGKEVAENETGLIRIFDLANVRSVLAVQTEDLGISRGHGFELIGRAALAESRGCSLMAAHI
ncbi:MAG: long-chain fatty acid--CoA ligase [Verrucomicrobiota bacterium]|nr:long-chain fatty acid--CoA ligase [Verrucomicrobiota bacterium]